MDNLLFVIVYVKQKNGGRNNSPSSLNIMVKYDYHGENWLIPIYHLRAITDVHSVVGTGY